MIHVNYKCKVNFVKLPSIWTAMCLKLVFENANASDQRKTLYRGADKSLAWPGRKQATATEDFELHISCL